MKSAEHYSSRIPHMPKLIKNMSDCSPHIMTAVPRFYQNLHQKINATFSKATGYKKILVNNTLRLGAKKLKKENMSISEKFMNLVVERLVRSKIKNQFGGSLKAFVSGGGALDKEIGTFLNAGVGYSTVFLPSIITLIGISKPSITLFHL